MSMYPDDDEGSVKPKTKTIIVLSLVGAGCAMFLGGLIVLLVSAGGKGIPGATGGKAKERVAVKAIGDSGFGRAEELVRRMILNNAKDSIHSHWDGNNEGMITHVDKKIKSHVRFVAWGPHMTSGEVKALAEEAGVGPEGLPIVGIAGVSDGTIIRVKYVTQPPDWMEPVYREELRVPRDKPPGEQTHDDLYCVSGKIVLPLGFGGGPHWKKELRKTLSKVYPAVLID